MNDKTARQPRDRNNNLVVEGAWIKTYLGSSDGVDRYVLELPEGTAHNTGPYRMERETP